MKNEIKKISEEEVEEIALLTRIAMTQSEIRLMAGQMSNILENIDVLNGVNTDDIEPTGHSSEVESVMREDVPTDSLELDDVMANAPRREGDFIRTRPVLE